MLRTTTNNRGNSSERAANMGGPQPAAPMWLLSSAANELRKTIFHMDLGDGHDIQVLFRCLQLTRSGATHSDCWAVYLSLLASPPSPHPLYVQLWAFAAVTSFAVLLRPSSLHGDQPGPQAAISQPPLGKHKCSPETHCIILVYEHNYPAAKLLFTSHGLGI